MPFLTKWLPGPFLRFVAESIPVYAIRELVVIIDYLTEWSIGLLRSKRDPSSDRSYELGDGKDIMSILCALSIHLRHSNSHRLFVYSKS